MKNMKSKKRLSINIPVIYFKKQKNPLETLPLTKIAIVTLIASAMLLAFSVVAIFFLPPQIPLYYFAGDPKNQIADSLLIIFPPILAIIFSVINFLLAVIVKSDFLKKILIIASLSITILAAISVLKIFFLVASF